MSFDTIDNVFLDILLTFTDTIEKCNKETLEYKFNLTPEIAAGREYKIKGTNKKGETSEFPIIVIGYFKPENCEFVWNDNMNMIIYDEVKATSKAFGSSIDEIFGSDKTLKKLFEPKVKIDLDKHNAIPYLAQLFLFNFNFVRFETDTKDLFLYTFIQINFNCPIDYDDFFKKIILYKSIVENNKSDKSDKADKADKSDKAELKRNSKSNINKKIVTNAKKIYNKLATQSMDIKDIQDIKSIKLNRTMSNKIKNKLFKKSSKKKTSKK
jgi:membrane-associated HD superfamily phosphohydrolase